MSSPIAAKAKRAPSQQGTFHQKKSTGITRTSPRRFIKIVKISNLFIMYSLKYYK
jgi:hypothetical protein